jgi:hypothetical protein
MEGRMSTELDDKIRESLTNGRLPCAVAFKIAKELGISVHEVGEVCNNLRIKVSSCQLGCFP